MINTQSSKEIAALILKIRANSEKFAQRKGWILNPDTLITDSIIEGLARNKLMRGKLYCPCRPPNNDPDVNKCFICPCRDAEKDVETTGHCHCYFFYMK